MDIKTTQTSPLRSIDVSFADYVARRRRNQDAHTTAGVPDYSFDLDYELRSKLTAIPHFTSLSRKISATLVTREAQLMNQQAMLVGPTQYPEIYQMGLDCAHRLGIGVPNLFVYSNPYINAVTYAADTISPTIVIFTGLLDRMTPGELKFVIGHECGHIHNQHLVYRYVINALLNGVTGTIGTMISNANAVLMRFWTRACEVTADRAGLICADDPRDAISAMTKLLTGGTFNPNFQQEIDVEALRAQMEETFDNPTRVYEFLSDHPSEFRRIFAMQEFEVCDVYYRWRPEQQKPGGLCRAKSETDANCKKLVNIVSNR